MFDVAERIRLVRAAAARIKEIEKEYDEKVKPFEEFLEQNRALLLQYLNETNQKSAATEHGTAYKSTKVTYRVTDKEEFRRHVIGTNSWELLSWAAADLACEQFTTENAEPPPGTFRNEILGVRILAPPKPRKRKAQAAQAAASGGEEEEGENNGGVEAPPFPVEGEFPNQDESSEG